MLNEKFHKFATYVSDKAGSPCTFIIALSIIVGWIASGPLFGFSDTWQLIINTGTTIITFLMVFLIQHSQNTDTDEIKTLVRELVRAMPEADTSLIREAEQDAIDDKGGS